MIHYTLSTGHTRHSPRSEVSDDALAFCRDLILRDGGRLMDVHHCVITREGGALACTVFRNQPSFDSGTHPHVPILTFGVASNDESSDLAWAPLESMYHQLTDHGILTSVDFAAAKRPESAPWIAALPIFASPAEAQWLADFERCVAWAFIDLLASSTE